MLALVPQPLLLLDALFLRFLARSMVRASDGLLDFDQAAKRVRRLEVLEPADSARLFASITFAASALLGAVWSGSAVKIGTVAVLAPFSAWLANRERESLAPKVVALATGMACIIVII